MATRGLVEGWFHYLGDTFIIEGLNPIEVAQYAVDNQLEREPAFSHWVNVVLRNKDRVIHMARRRRMNNTYQYGIEVPRSVKHALELDKKNGNNLWAQAIKKEMDKVMVAFKVLEPGEDPPSDSKLIPLRMIFAVKMDFTRKARLVAGGHMTDPPTSSTYSSVAARDSVRIIFLIAGHNKIPVTMADIGNAYLNAPTSERVHAVAGPEFGQYEGCIVIIVRALYGLRSAGASWHSHLSDTLRSLKFASSNADHDVWMRAAVDRNSQPYYEYVVVYVDDLLIVSHDHQRIFEALGEKYEVKPTSGRYLGMKVNTFIVGKGTKEEREAWYMSAEDYLKHALKVIEDRYPSSKSEKKVDAPMLIQYHPEIDESPYLDDSNANYYQSLIGILQWAVELGRIAENIAKLPTAYAISMRPSSTAHCRIPMRD
ncbi:MAG: reverse transcriptase domain-containing protein [Bacteroidota bacterium]